jgi:Flp pilus assembly protein TadD
MIVRQDPSGGTLICLLPEDLLMHLTTFRDFQRILIPQMFLAALLLASTPSLSTAADPPAKTAEIVSLEGSGEFRAGAQQAWNAARVKQELFPGQFVRTGELSRMGLSFIDQSQIRINQNTVLQIKEVAAPGSGSQTVLSLLSGQAWSQAKNAARGLKVQTPSATAAIRGTDWELRVDDQGRSTLTVLSGEVEFFNDFGSLTVTTSEQAIAEIGKAPVKLLISNPRERVQWVTAYAVDPLRFIRLSGSSALPMVLAPPPPPEPVASRTSRAAALADSGRWDEARKLFESALASEPGNPAALVGLAFAALHEGDSTRASELLARVPASDASQQELVALGQIAALLEDGRFQTARARLERLAPVAAQAAPYLLLADLMILSGETERAVSYATDGLARFPEDARLRCQQARAYLLADRLAESAAEVRAALTADARSVDAYVAQGDLARRQGNAGEARAAYLSALALNPNDPRAWYGLGVIHNEREDLRRGRSELRGALSLDPRGPGYRGELGTLETFASRFDTAETEYGRALDANPDDYIALTGQGLLELKRGHADAALVPLLHAGLLEPRYARVHMYLAVAYYRLGRTQQVREELARASKLDPKDPFPHMLSSIIDTDLFAPGDAIEAGRTAMRLMPYLKSLNQLANNQKGTANLGNAFAFFGLEDWALSLAQESYYPYWAGSHLFLGDRYPGLFNKNSEYFQGLLADPTAFGASTRFQSLLPKPGNYLTAGLRAGVDKNFYAVQPYVTANGYALLPAPAAYFLDFEHTRLDPRAPSLDANADSVTGAIGMAATPELGFFGYGNMDNVHATVTDPDAGLQNSPLTMRDRKFDLGAHYRFSPQSTLWFKAGYGRDTTALQGLFEGGRIDLLERENNHDFQLRHTFSAGRRHEITWGIELGHRDKFTHLDLDSTSEPGSLVIDQPITDQSEVLYGSDRVTLGESLLIQGDLFVQHYSKHVHTVVLASDETGIQPGELFESAGATDVLPRVGLVYRFGDQHLVRFAYQRFARPASVSTLSPVATAGIPLNDRFAQLGGTSSRYQGQFEWAWTPTTFTTAWAAHETVTNLSLADGVQQAPSLESLQKIRNQILINPAAVDLLEETPVFGRGNVTWSGLTLSQLLGRQWSVYSRYMFTSSENTGDQFRGNPIPLLPRHLVALGATWVSTHRVYVTGQAVRRSRRFLDEANQLPSLAPDWHGTLKGYWELPSKRWSFEVNVDDIFSKTDPVAFTADLKFRY